MAHFSKAMRVRKEGYRKAERPGVECDYQFGEVSIKAQWEDSENLTERVKKGFLVTVTEVTRDTFKLTMSSKEILNVCIVEKELERDDCSGMLFLTRFAGQSVVIRLKDDVPAASGVEDLIENGFQISGYKDKRCLKGQFKIGFNADPMWEIIRIELEEFDL